MKNLLLNLKTPHKFTLLGVLAAIAIVLPCVLYLRAALQDLNFARQEASGLPVVLELYDVVRLTQEHRGLSNTLLAGDAGAAPQREAKAAEVSQAVEAMSRDLAARAVPSMQKEWAPLAAQWQAIAADLGAGRVDGPQSFERHMALVAGELKFMASALDAYGWALDPEPGTYYSVMGSAVDGLQLTERLGQLRALGAAALTRKASVPPPERNKILGALVLAQDSYTRSKAALDRAGRAEAAMGQAYAPLQAKLADSLGAVLAATEKDILGEGMAMAPADYWQAATGLIRQQFEINRVATGFIRQQIEQRVASRQATITTLSLVLALAAVAYALAAWFVARTTAQRLRVAQQAAEAIAGGDLGMGIAQAGRDELGQLLAALSAMQRQLAGIVTEVRRNSEHVATASAEIAQGNDDLSARTEQQASSLEETAASMEQMSSTIRQNADNAQQANQLVVDAAGVAQRGGEAVGRVVSTMQSIQGSSSRIADITGVIDGIAFQTNILALNAAVEAARAGEQGRGFAVVASEVRTLAQRSAAAAKEIKLLIGESVGRVDEGVAQVEQAGRTMQEVVTSIRRVTDIVAEIAAASREQASGAGQINEAVAHMDQATQQNAALVEQSAAAAQSLRAQADQLVRAVAVFRVGAGVPLLEGR
ncbi:MAG: methyl-accepting chemotaxis protein [Acidovorax sp.]